MSADEITLMAKALSPIARACADELPHYTPIGVFTVWDASADPSAASVPVPGLSATL